MNSVQANKELIQKLCSKFKDNWKETFLEIETLEEFQELFPPLSIEPLESYFFSTTLAIDENGRKDMLKADNYYQYNTNYFMLLKYLIIEKKGCFLPIVQLFMLHHPNLLNPFGWTKTNESEVYLFHEKPVANLTQWCLNLHSIQDYQKIALNLFKDAIKAICYLHEIGNYHGSLSPRNIYIYKNEKDSKCPFILKIGDFGNIGNKLRITYYAKSNDIDFATTFVFKDNKDDIVKSNRNLDVFDLGFIGVLLGKPENITNPNLRRVQSGSNIFHSKYPIQLDDSFPWLSVIQTCWDFNQPHEAKEISKLIESFS